MFPRCIGIILLAEVGRRMGMHSEGSEKRVQERFGKIVRDNDSK